MFKTLRLSLRDKTCAGVHVYVCSCCISQGSIKTSFKWD